MNCAQCQTQSRWFWCGFTEPWFASLFLCRCCLRRAVCLTACSPFSVASQSHSVFGHTHWTWATRRSASDIHTRSWVVRLPHENHSKHIQGRNQQSYSETRPNHNTKSECFHGRYAFRPVFSPFLRKRREREARNAHAEMLLHRRASSHE